MSTSSPPQAPLSWADDDFIPAVGGPSASAVAAGFREGVPTSDGIFDRFLERDYRLVSRHFWTPVDVAVKVAAWLEELEVKTVVDIGAGPGKFCVAAALAGNARFIGLEQRPRLVEAARELARIFHVQDRVEFVQGALGESEVPSGDAYYLYNPFGENIFGPEDRLDEEVELGDERYHRDITHVERLLAASPEGTCLITYNGFGGHVPASFREMRLEQGLPNVLRLWRKAPKK